MTDDRRQKTDPQITQITRIRRKGEGQRDGGTEGMAESAEGMAGSAMRTEHGSADYADYTD